VTACGMRDSMIMKLQLAFSTACPVRISHTAEGGIILLL